jgi:hypothetical protein
MDLWFGVSRGTAGLTDRLHQRNQAPERYGACVISVLEKSAMDSIAESLANSGIRNPKSPIQNPELIK